MSNTNHDHGLEKRLDSIREELSENYAPPVVNYAIRFIGALIEHLHSEKEMSGETREEVMYCIHRLLSWTADYQKKED